MLVSHFSNSSRQSPPQFSAKKMGVLCSRNKCIFEINLLVFCFNIIILLSGSPKFGLALGNETDRLALLSLKDQLIGNGDPGALDSWNASLHFCEWQGVTCGHRHQRVIALKLDSLKLPGSISPSLGNLSFLREVNLSYNRLQGSIPKEVGYLRRLRVLDMSENSLQGRFPVELANCSNLQSIILASNNLTGEVPFQLGGLPKLAQLDLSTNNLVGEIPSSLGNLSSLMGLSLASNQFEGNIPSALGRASNLRILYIGINNLFGTIPPTIYNLSNLESIDIALNHLSGILAPDLGLAFPNLSYFSINHNQFIGTFPRSISNCSSLEIIDIGRNGFSGSLLETFGNLKNLLFLGIGHNNFGHGKPGDLDFLSSLKNCSMLQELWLESNRFGGVLPESVGNVSTQLRVLYFAGNQISGNIPEVVGNLVGLTLLAMDDNVLTGSIPTSIGKLRSLEIISFAFNLLSGEIPSFLGNLTRLFGIYTDANNFEGRIPLALRNCKNMQTIAISNNKLNGSIPDQLFGLFTSLVQLDLSYNALTGPIPSDFGNMKNLVELYASKNKLSGEIPQELGQCSGLVTLDMAGNFLQGRIPLSFGSLKSLQTLNLSRNNLSGKIPPKLEQLPYLSSLNLSFNHLEGKVPEGGVFNRSSGFSIIGNDNLCGGIPELNLSKCFNHEPRKKGIALSTKVIIVLIIGILIFSIMVLLLFFLCCRKRFGKELIPATLFGDGYLRVSYKELLDATGGFAASNLIGSGSSGSVYKGVLHQQEKAVAVKVLNLQNHRAAKSFMAECRALRKVRHRNLLKVITSCSSIDYQRNDFKALVFEFMPNGSLESRLHEQHESRRYLNLAQRLDITIDVANAIDYLHHGCETLIVHCDLKPSNILLDDEMVAHVGDFGLAKLLSGDTGNMGTDQTGSSMIKGTIGYVAPEYGVGGSVSPEGDVYSYGILLLEMATGRRPTDDLFCDGLSLHIFCQMALPERLGEVIDFRLLEEIGGIGQRLRSRPNLEGEIWECLASFIKIGVACSAESPDERMGIKDAIAELNATKARLLRTRISTRDRR